MTDFEKVQIGFDIAFVVLAGIGLVELTCINDWLERDFHAKFGYTKFWGVA